MELVFVSGTGLFSSLTIFPAGAPAGAAACGRCGASVRPEFRLCPFCGNSLQARCRKCDGPVEADWKVCPHCTATLDELPDSPALR